MRLGSFTGGPVIAAMDSTICRDNGPAIVAEMTWVEKHLPPDEVNRVRFAFFSFDGEADTRQLHRHCERSEAIQGPQHAAPGLLVARAPRNDGDGGKEDESKRASPLTAGPRESCRPTLPAVGRSAACIGGRQRR